MAVSVNFSYKEYIAAQALLHELLLLFSFFSPLQDFYFCFFDKYFILFIIIPLLLLLLPTVSSLYPLLRELSLRPLSLYFAVLEAEDLSNPFTPLK